MIVALQIKLPALLWGFTFHASQSKTNFRLTYTTLSIELMSCLDYVNLFCSSGLKNRIRFVHLHCVVILPVLYTSDMYWATGKSEGLTFAPSIEYSKWYSIKYIYMNGGPSRKQKKTKVPTNSWNIIATMPACLCFLCLGPGITEYDCPWEQGYLPPRVWVNTVFYPLRSGSSHRPLLSRRIVL